MADARNDAGFSDSSTTDGSAPDERQRSAAGASADDADLTDEIRRRAYERWVSRGDAPGSEYDDWFDAEREVRATRSSGGRPADVRQEEPGDEETRQAADSRSNTEPSSARGRRSRGQSAGDARGDARGESIGDQRAEPA